MERLNNAVRGLPRLPVVEFDPALISTHQTAAKWYYQKHKEPGQVHEPATIAAFVAIGTMIQPKVIFDLGAAYGYFSLLCDMLFPQSQITAFEMHQSIMEALCINCEPRTRCVHALMTDRLAKHEKIWVSGFNVFEEPADGWDALKDDPGAMKPRGENNRGAGFVLVNMLTLDEHCRVNPDPDIIKIDVEAYQAKAILGGMEMIRRKRPYIILEIHDAEKVARMGTTNRETVKPLLDIGYRAFWCGNFRSPNARFEKVSNNFLNLHDKLSLVVLAP